MDLNHNLQFRKLLFYPVELTEQKGICHANITNSFYIFYFIPVNLLISSAFMRIISITISITAINIAGNNNPFAAKESAAATNSDKYITVI